MSNTHLRIVGVFLLQLGVALVLVNGITIVQANLTGQGSTLSGSPAPHAVMTPVHSAAPAAPAVIVHQAQTELFIGMILIIVGFLFYMLAHIRETTGKVRVKAVPSKRAADEAARMKRRGPKFFWMEIRI